MGILYSEPRSALPPGSSPPSYESSIWTFLSPQQVDILSISHRPQNLVVQQPGGVVVHAQVAAELSIRSGVGLAHANISPAEPLAAG